MRFSKDTAFKLSGRSLSQVVGFWVLVLAMASNLILGGTLTYQNYLSRANKLRSEVHQALNILKEGLAVSVWTFDDMTTRSLSRSILEQSEGLFLQVKIRSTGQPDFNIIRQGYDEKSLNERVSSIEVHRVDVLQDQQKIAEVELSVDQGAMKSEILKGLFFSIPLILLTTLFSAWIIRRMMTKKLTEPLSGLVEDIRQAELQNFDVRAREDYEYELGLLGRSFNQAIVAIQTRDQALKQNLDNLESIVEQRTHERDDQIAKNVHTARLVAIGELSASMAHEINNPMSVI